MRFSQTLASAAFIALLPAVSLAQTTASSYPSRPVTVILSFAPGGSSDREARLETARMVEQTGQPFIIDYKTGAGGTIGAAYVAKAKPDGYTLLVVSGGFAAFPSVYKKLSFDALKDFSPISLMSYRTNVLLTRASFPAKTIPEYISYARANPGKVTFGTAGSGALVHLAGEWLQSLTNTKVTFVHYKGQAPGMVDLLAGRLDVATEGIPASIAAIKTGKVRALAIMNNQRHKLMPGVPTIAEQGVPEYNYMAWQGYVAPNGTSPAIINKLSGEFAKAAKAPNVAGPLESEGGVMVGSNPQQFRALIVTEAARWRKLVAEAGIKLQ